jgi:hypothetical protein
MYNFDDYNAFAAKMHEKFPKIFSEKYGGFSIGPGWWHIVESLCNHIQGYIDYVNKRRNLLLEDNPHNVAIPDEVPQVIVGQIKEKFGGLRFYYDGGDEKIDGMVQLAEAWAAHTCDVCGSKGKSRADGWIRTLCDEHHEERKNK